MNTVETTEVRHFTLTAFAAPGVQRGDYADIEVPVIITLGDDGEPREWTTPAEAEDALIRELTERAQVMLAGFPGCDAVRIHEQNVDSDADIWVYE
jgi:hypothetical protein